MERASEAQLETPARGAMDQLLAASVLLLVGFGIVMIYSSSAVFAHRNFENAQYFLEKQFMWVGIGLACMMVMSRIGYRATARLALPLLGLTVLLLVLVLTPVGTSINGAQRWIRFAGFTFQPGELAKMTLVVWLAYSLTRKATKIKTFTVGFLPHMLVAGLLMMVAGRIPRWIVRSQERSIGGRLGMGLSIVVVFIVLAGVVLRLIVRET